MSGLSLVIYTWINVSQLGIQQDYMTAKQHYHHLEYITSKAVHASKRNLITVKTLGSLFSPMQSAELVNTYMSTVVSKRLVVTHFRVQGTYICSRVNSSMVYASCTCYVTNWSRSYYHHHEFATNPFCYTSNTCITVLLNALVWKESRFAEFLNQPKGLDENISLTNRTLKMKSIVVEHGDRKGSNFQRRRNT